MNRKTLLLVAALAALPFANPHAIAQPAPAGASASATLADGEVRKVDKAAGTVVLKHGEIRSVGMGPMTMEFKAADPKLLEGLKPGDKVRFDAAMSGQQLTVTRIERVK